MSGTNEPGSPGDDELPDQDEFELPEDLDEDEAPEEVPEEDLAPPEDQPPPRQSRRERQEANWRERAIRAEAERDAYRNVRQQAPQPQQRIDPQAVAQARAQEYQRISMLPPEEQVAAIDQMIQRQTAMGTLQAFDVVDRDKFDRIKAQYPAARRLADKVENALQQQRQQGIYQFSREQIYYHFLGEEIHQKSVEGATRQRQTGQRNVQRQTVQPRRQARGDVATSGNRARGADADRRLLESIRIEDL